MSDAMPLLGTSRTRRRILEEFFTRPRTVVHVRELARRTGIAPGLAQRELRQLESWGILTSETVGRARRYRVDEDSPILAEVRSLFQKTAGIEQRVRRALDGMPDIEAAALYGSYAAGRDRPGSDLDLLIVGQPNRVALSQRLAPLEREIGREVNTTILRREELDRLRREGSGFVTDVLSKPLVRLIGPDLRTPAADG
jgi:predicted nucleotidyltransferase